MLDQYDIIIIGAGPAGLMTAIESYQPNKNILILEKKYKPALKLRISGKGRCNITNDANYSEFISHFGKNGRFLKYSFSEFFNTDLLKFFNDLDVYFKLERGNRYFPKNDDANEIVNALLNKINSLGIKIETDSEVKIIEKNENNFTLTINNTDSINNGFNKQFTINANNVVIATGGKSYPGTGSDGNGYKLASRLGHRVTKILPALVPIETKGKVAQKLQGLALKNVNVEVRCENKKIDEEFGEMIFTDFGVSGPIILSLSKTIVKLLTKGKKVNLVIDLKPALDHPTVDRRLLREIDQNSKKIFKSLLKTLLPNSLIPVFIELLKIPQDKQLSQINSEERKKLRMLLKEFTFEVKDFKMFSKAIITSGGINIKEINEQTMESKIVDNLFFVGEIIDIDADTGGYNLQAAFSTGWIAGKYLKNNY
ncbi:MAG: NAD(P)/FAD-dependent oxidoreductase [Candidatus Marinimicrobia bacterium]|nr:NAD(P)/FAD-dependent oxidoreductase [Candidatus Neomarinimicrobiota bacterium]